MFPILIPKLGDYMHLFFHDNHNNDDDDVCLEYYSGKGFHINYSCLHGLRKTHKLVQQGISNEHKKCKHMYIFSMIIMITCFQIEILLYSIYIIILDIYT
jgi:hypothetical protein